MSLLNTEERNFAETSSRFARCNPFLPERDEAMREILGGSFVEGDKGRWEGRFDRDFEDLGPNLAELSRRSFDFAKILQNRLRESVSATAVELELYEDIALSCLYRPQMREFDRAISSAIVFWFSILDIALLVYTIIRAVNRKVSGFFVFRQYLEYQRRDTVTR